jgi:hypothetical protein
MSETLSRTNARFDIERHLKHLLHSFGFEEPAGAPAGSSVFDARARCEPQHLLIGKFSGNGMERLLCPLRMAPTGKRLFLESLIEHVEVDRVGEPA